VDNGRVADRGAYAEAGVDAAGADRALGGLVEVLRAIDTGKPSRSLLASGHYAAVLRLDDRSGLALCTDGVGSKVIVAEQAGRFDTIGIDCVAMNVNDVVCVGAEPIALLDYLAVEQVDPEALGEIAQGLKHGAEQAGVEIPGGELAVLPELIRGHPSPHGFDLCASCFGTVRLDAIIDGTRCAPGDALLGLPSSGLHSNGYTLARRVLLADAGLRLDDRAVLDLLAADLPVHGLAHITGDGVLNLLRLGAGSVGYEIDEPLPVPAVCGLVCELGGLDAAEAYRVFNMGCGFVAITPENRAAEALAVLERHHPGTAVIGRVTDRAGQVALPGLGVTGDRGGLAVG
jgi:phosphoribosylformylglycinamidine cyclo-ligase